MQVFPSKLKKHIHILILGLFIFTQIFGSLFLYAKPAEAQMPTSNAILDSASVQETIDRVAAKRMEELQGTWWVGLVSAVTNAVGYFANKIAYDAAVAIASLGSGQTPTFFTQDWGSYLTDTALNSAGEFIGSISESYGDELGSAGLGSLCMPPDPQLRLNIGLSLGDSVAPNGPQPRCEWSNIVEQWDTFITEASTPEVLNRVSLQFSPNSGSGLGAFVQARGQMQDNMEKTTKAATKEREEGEGFKSVGDLITKHIKTPSTVVKDSITKQIDPKSSSEQNIEEAGAKAGSAGALVGQNALSMLGGIASTFVNTLASKLMDRVMGGLFSLGDIGKLFRKGGSGLDNPEFAGLGGRAVAEATFADFLTPRIQEASRYDPLVEMMTCPSGVNKAPENCVLDSQFVQAIPQATMGDPLTVSGAIQKNLLRGDWPLIASTDSRHNDQYCFQKGYCYSNLVKLRKYRILPVGWVMAASLADGERTGATLKMVMNNFNNCNAEGIADNDHPWCHLIDPNWILKVPAHQCKARVYGAISIEGNRAETCVDAPSCIAEDDNGVCESGWGYCVREKNIWRLPGDACDRQFDSCRALRTRAGEIKSYLISTVDYGPPCSADDVGCKWYSTYQAKVGEEEYKWQDSPSDADADEKTDRIYFNKNVAQCNEEGCSEFYKTSKETNLNLIANSSFEEISDDEIKNWVKEGAGGISPVPTAKDGGNALELLGGAAINQVIHVGKPLVGRTLVLSFYARNAGDVGCAGNATINSFDSFLRGPAIETLRIVDSSNSWKRYKTNGVYFSNNPAENLMVRIIGNNCLIDAVQLEEASGVTDYHNAWAGLGDGLNMKKAPEYYNCYNYNADGTAKTTDDAPQCSNFIGACQENEAGCEKYTPKDGDPPIPGITSFPNDYCPQECVGYQTFKQLETNFEEEKYPLFFIPKTAEKCSASQDGCDEFTSLETEAIENYSYLRQCQKPGGDSATFYTWEGSDTTGYQLKTWSLKSGNEVDVPISEADPEGGTAPCIGFAPGIEDGRRACAPLPMESILGFFHVDMDTEGVCTKADTVVGAITYNPDCREFYDASGKRHYRLYSKTIVATDDCHEYRKTYSSESDCDTSGGLWNVASAAGNDCKYDVYPAESKRCSSVGCRAYRGNAGANVRNVFQNNFETGAEEWIGRPAVQVYQSSEAVDNGGHSLKIETGAVAEKSVAGEIKKDGIYLISFWAKTEAARGSAGFQFDNGNGTPRLEGETAIPNQNLTLSWQQYTIGPIEVKWDPTADNLETDAVVEGDKLQVTANGATIYLDNILFKEVVDRIYLVKDSWSTPATCDMTSFGGYLPQAMLGCEEYRDRDNRQHFLKSFTSLCREEAIGCQKLVDTKNSQSPYGEVYNGVCVSLEDPADLRDLDDDGDSECSLVAGCSCVVNEARFCTVPRGQNSCRYNSIGVISDSDNRKADTVEIKADSYAFLVVDKSKNCNPSNIGCEAFGAPKLDSMGSIICTMPDGDDGGTDPDTCHVSDGCECKRDGTKMCTVPDGENSCTGDFDAVNLLNNPKFYEGQSKILCEASYDTCEEYLGSDGAKFYFRDPGKRTCDWKENITYGGEKRSGWFRKDNDGADIPCYPDYTSAGVFGIWKNADPGYEGRVGNCPADQNLCTKFVDPTATSGENPEGEPYFYLKNDKLMDRAGECNGEVSLQQGCILFDDTSNLNKLYNANITYAISEKGTGSVEPGGKVVPVDCTNSTDCKKCTLRPLPPPSPPSPSPSDLRYPICDDPTADCNKNHYCFSDTDCSADYACTSRLSIKNNTNLIFKVRKDRVCGEWLSCKTSNTIWDSYTNKKREICEGVGLCNKVAEGNQAVTCGQWIDDNLENDTPQILDLKQYTSRDTGWSGQEYSGYSIPNQFQAYKLSQVNLSNPETTNSISAESDWRLGLVEEKVCFNEDGEVRGCDTDEEGTCDGENDTECIVPPIAAIGISPAIPGRTGKCWNKKCIYDPEGRLVDGFPKFAEYKPLEKDNKEFAPLCRAYPEKNSPFPRSVAYNEAGGTARKQGFGNAQVCETQKVCSRGDNMGEFCSGEEDCLVDGVVGLRPSGFEICTVIQNACDCSYTKLSYGGTTKYIHRKNNESPGAICVGGSKAGVACSLDSCPGIAKPADARDGAVSACACGWLGQSGTGTCTAKDKVETVLGMDGYCLEKDKTTYINGSPEENACLTWLPIDHLNGSVDVYNQFVHAGYAPGDNGQMCLETELYVRPKPIWGCAPATGALDHRTSGACEYDYTYNDVGGPDTYDMGDSYCEYDRDGDACISGEPAPKECTHCPTGWTYIEAGCSPTDDTKYCGGSGTSLDDCIYYCIPPGPLLNNRGTSDILTDDIRPEELNDSRTGQQSVCFPDRLISEGGGANGYFQVKDGENFIDSNSQDSRRSHALYCEGDYYVKKADYDDMIRGLDGKTVGYMYPSRLGSSHDFWVSPPLQAQQQFFLGCAKIVEVGKDKDISKAWTDRIYQNTKSCIDGICVPGSLRSGLSCGDDLPDCNTVRSDILGEDDVSAIDQDIPELDYLYTSEHSPFGYAQIIDADKVRNQAAQPLSVPFCTDDIKMVMPTTGLVCEEDEGELFGSPSARPYLNFSYRKRQSCPDGDDKKCNPSPPSIECNVNCYQKCEREEDCPDGTSCPLAPILIDNPETDAIDESAPQTMGAFMTLDESSGCPAIADEPVRYCVVDEGGSEGLNERSESTGGNICTSACIRSGQGVPIGTCSNTRGLCRVVEDCYQSLCVTDARNGAHDSTLDRWLRRVGLAWDDWRGGGPGYCSGIVADILPIEPEHEGEEYNTGETRIAELFAKSFKIYDWSPKEIPGFSAEVTYEDMDEPDRFTDRGVYAETASPAGGSLLDDTFSTWDITETGDPITGEVPNPPHVAPLKLPCINDKCSPLTDGGAENYVSGITVNDKNSGTLISRSGELSASIKFFAWADKNQMPIKRVCVDFNGDGRTNLSSDCDGGNPVNFYKNHWGYKNDGSKGCDRSSDFGHAPQACTEDFFSYNTVYSCGEGGGGLPACDATHTSNCFDTNCPDSSVRGGCCVFRPRVHVLDNWGWCTGQCEGRRQGGCYGTEGLSGECDIDRSNPHWVTSGVKVIV